MLYSAGVKEIILLPVREPWCEISSLCWNVCSRVYLSTPCHVRIRAARGAFPGRFPPIGHNYPFHSFCVFLFVCEKRRPIDYLLPVGTGGASIEILASTGSPTTVMSDTRTSHKNGLYRGEWLASEMAKPGLILQFRSGRQFVAISKIWVSSGAENQSGGRQFSDQSAKHSAI